MNKKTEIGVNYIYLLKNNYVCNIRREFINLHKLYTWYEEKGWNVAIVHVHITYLHFVHFELFDCSI